MVRSKYDWQTLYQEFVQSGLCKTAFIKREHLPTSAFARLGEMMEEAKETVFIPVTVTGGDKISSDEPAGHPEQEEDKDSLPENSPLLIARGDYRITVLPDFDQATLLHILEVLEQCLG